MNIAVLEGINIEQDKNNIFKDLNDKIFVYTGKGYLCDYIDRLDLGDNALYKLKMCQEVENMNIQFECAEKEVNDKFDKLSDLLIILDPNIESKVIVMGDADGDEEKIAKVRKKLSSIVQQFVYLNLPLDKIQVMTEREYKNYDKIKRFSQSVTVHEKNVQSSRDRMANMGDGKYADIIDRVNTSLDKISDYLKESKNNELKIATAASKKTGKSVIVNSIIGCELAPTSLELATPNNCIYKASENGFVLEMEGKKMNFASAQEMKKYILREFKAAEEKEGCGIPDMNIGYIPLDNGLSSYTIYDTPGPDLAGADDHKKAAYKAINEVDVVIFSIDYSKYLTDTEMSYLKDIKEVFSEKQKFYSLIINVNKLDLRYGNEGDKSVVRILDFIKKRLISIAPEFEDAIVIGTSALTYFNCIEAEKISETDQLSGEKFWMNLVELVQEFSMNPEKREQVNVLQFLSNVTSNTQVFSGIVVKNLEQIKIQSGMPNLLGYIRYIAENKARIEKVNNLIYKIDQEYANIQNLFHFQQLEEELAQNQNLLEAANEVLEKFRTQINDIYDDRYPDISRMNKNGELVSTTLMNLARQSELSFEDISLYFENQFVDVLLDDNKIKKEVISNVRGELEERLNLKFADSTLSRYIDGKERTVVKEEEIRQLILGIIKHLDAQVNKQINVNSEELDEDLKYEFNQIMDDLVKMVNNRGEKLKEAVHQCEQELQKECEIEFSIELPEFEFEFKRNEDDSHSKIKVINNTFLRRINENMDGKINHSREIKDNLGEKAVDYIMKGLIGKVLEAFDVKKSYNRITYDPKYIMTELYDHALSHNIMDAMNESEFANDMDDLKKDYKEIVEKFVEKIESEMQDQMKHANAYANAAAGAINRSKEYENNISELTEKQRLLERIKECVDIFCLDWKSSIKKKGSE